MKNSTTEINEIILLHLQGKASEAENARLQMWLTESPENVEIFSEYQQVWSKTEVQETEFTPDVERAWQKVQLRANLNSSSAPSSSEVQSGKTIQLIWRVAAAIVFIVGFGFLALKVINKEVPMKTVASKNERMDITLPDGSVVTLNKNSSLKYPQSFSDNTRDIYLDGEAFFKVKRDTTKPFTVHCKLTSTQVLGTSFNIRAFASENEEQTSVLTGRVAFIKNGSTDKLILTPGLKGEFKSKGKLNLQKMQTENALAWKNRTLQFDDASLADAADDLEAYFGKKIEVSDEVKDLKFTGTFKNPTIDQVLTVISISTNTQISSKDSTITISK